MGCLSGDASCQADIWGRNRQNGLRGADALLRRQLSWILFSLLYLNLDDVGGQCWLLRVLLLVPPLDVDFSCRGFFLWATCLVPIFYQHLATGKSRDPVWKLQW